MMQRKQILNLIIASLLTSFWIHTKRKGKQKETIFVPLNNGVFLGSIIERSEWNRYQGFIIVGFKFF
jgi:hypothetical protein